MSLRRKCEDAFRAVIANNWQGNVYAATAGGELEFPFVVVQYLGGTENPVNTGNHSVRVSIEIQTELDEDGNPVSKGQHDDIVETVENVLRYDDLAALLTAAVDEFTVAGFEGGEHQEQRIIDAAGVMVDAFSVDFYAAQSDFEETATGTHSLVFSTSSNSMYLPILP